MSDEFKMSYNKAIQQGVAYRRNSSFLGFRLGNMGPKFFGMKSIPEELREIEEKEREVRKYEQE